VLSIFGNHFTNFTLYDYANTDPLQQEVGHRL
jgi:hypothetical protein